MINRNEKFMNELLAQCEYDIQPTEGQVQMSKQMTKKWKQVFFKKLGLIHSGQLHFLDPRKQTETKKVIGVVQ